MTEAFRTLPLLDEQVKPVAKLRPCLRCRTEFQSKWAGERICARCKGTTAWRSGVPMPTGSGNKQR